MHTNKKGFTITELMITVTITLIIIPILIVLFISTNKNFIIFEAASTLKQANQNTINRIYVRLGRNKRIFQNTVNDNAFLAKVDLSGSPSVMGGSVLALVKPSGSFSSVSADFDSSAFGNSLFFAYNIAPAILEGIETDETGSETQTVRVDLYRFLYYYLTPDDAPSFAGRQAYKLVEWESNVYADCEQIERISNSAKESNVVNALVTGGMDYCFYTSQSDVLNAFYKLESGQLTLDAAHEISKNKYQILTKILTGMLGQGYKYAISPNTSGMPNIRKTVPVYAVATGNFPAGFEVGIAGLSAGRRVLIRNVLMAQTGIGSFATNEMSVISSSRDIW
jgi:hypothetical protein